MVNHAKISYMPQTLYRKYRPRKFSEIIGQQHIIQTLSNAIKHNRIGQAYLFTGPRGTGKTTIARIFAKAVNCLSRPPRLVEADRSDAKADRRFEPCNQCAVCQNINEGRSLDIIEIDAASNTGVDNIRELRETVKLPPTQAKYKVYIIDEVHMLSTGAFNALLKTLEEPPAHVIFILATTEIHKVPETIISRCQRFDFSRLTLEQIVKKLSSIAKLENVEIEKDALEMIAIAAEGGMRDAESTLAQIIALEDKNITAKEVEEILGAARHQSVEKLAELILAKNSAGALSLVNKISEEGANFKVLHKSLLNYLRQLMIASISPDLSGLFSLELTKEQIKKLENQAKSYSPKQILYVLENLIETQNNLRSSFIPQLPLEMAIVKSTQQLTTDNSQLANDFNCKSSSPLGRGNEGEGEKENPKSEISPKPKIQNFDVKIPNIKYQIRDTKYEIQDTNSVTIETIKKNWQQIIESTRPHNHSLMAFLSNCQPAKVENNKVIIATRYNLYKDKLNEKNNRLTIEEVFDKILNSRVTVKFVTEEEAGIKITRKLTTDNLQPKENKSLLDDAMKIMGGKVVKE